jgi:hypothetical protein
MSTFTAAEVTVEVCPKSLFAGCRVGQQRVVLSHPARTAAPVGPSSRAAEPNLSLREIPHRA